MKNIIKAREKIVECVNGQNNVSGAIDCPICLKHNALTFAVQNNHHIHAKCETVGCVRWME